MKIANIEREILLSTLESENNFKPIYISATDMVIWINLKKRTSKEEKIHKKHLVCW